MPSSKLISGITIPNDSITSTRIVNGTIQAVDLVTGGQIKKIQLNYTRTDDSIFGGTPSDAIPSMPTMLIPPQSSTDDPKLPATTRSTSSLPTP